MTVTEAQLDAYLDEHGEDMCNDVGTTEDRVAYAEVRDEIILPWCIGPLMENLKHLTNDVPPTRVPVVFHEYHDAWEIEYWVKSVERTTVKF